MMSFIRFIELLLSNAMPNELQSNAWTGITL